MEMADIISEQPVTDLVAQALEQAAVENGHTIGNGGLRISGSVNRYWLETDVNFWSLEMIGTVEAELIFEDSTSGEVLYHTTYHGSYKENRQLATASAYEDIMIGALNSLIEEVVFDDDLASVLRAYAILSQNM